MKQPDDDKTGEVTSPDGVVDDPAAAFGLTSDTVRAAQPRRAFGQKLVETEPEESDE